MDGGGVMKVTTLKGLVHAGLAIAALAETKNAKAKCRTLLLGAAAGWHMQAAFYHWFIEKG